MRYGYDSYKFLMVVNRNLTLDLFLRRAGAERGYAKTMFTNMYNSIFAECHYVEDEYVQYYKSEYDDLKQYLHVRYCISKKWADKLIAEKEANPNYTIIAYDSLSFGDGSIDSLMFEDKLADRIENLLMLKEQL